MKCNDCVALCSDEGYECYATEWWCAVAEEQIEFADGSVGCLRRSKEKLERDMKRYDELECSEFAEECKCLLEYLSKDRI